jgi:hypothetical protein
MAVYLKTLKKHDCRQTCILNAAMGVLCLFLFMRKSFFNKEVKILLLSKQSRKWKCPSPKVTSNYIYAL